ncbi:NAD-dependent epimerase/dehydratase family protein [Halorussus halophilus]|uniref:NAD-dependent epimerase/dehydratase family protein n=1 Tax=Halorussus halophilus TaxID=2650975 RepID=UPI0013019B52|nr:NAD(P)-dependent oxidoreductase [Halorussus halophilus]
MNVFIAGSTGVLGHRLVAKFTDSGHDVVGLTRDESGDQLVEARGGDPVRGDIFDRESLVSAAEGADVVVHAATAIPTKEKPTAEDWKLNDRVRREGAENLSAAAAEVGAQRYLQQSISWVARQPDGETFDESATPHPDRTTESALDAEQIAKEAGNEHGFETVVLRCGWFYAPDAAHTKTIGEGLLAKELPIVGTGLLGRNDAELSILHVEDAARAFVAAAEGDATGLYHVVDDEPVTVANLFSEFADKLGAPEPRRVPGWLAKYLTGEHTVRLLTSPAPTSAEKFKRDFDWQPKYPTYREGVEAVVEQWNAEGTLTEPAESNEWKAAA